MNPLVYFDLIKKTAVKNDALYLFNIIFLWITAIIISFSVLAKIVEYGMKQSTPKNESGHIVETFSMAAVIIVIFNVLQFGRGVIQTDLVTRELAAGFGAIFSAAGCYMHVWSKIVLGKYWSNMIEIQMGHKIITTGPYAIVRHPMYSSLVLWIAAESLMFMNWIGLALTLAVFTPMMIFRASAEDKLLNEADPTGFMVFQRDVKQLLPRFTGWFSAVIRVAAIAVLLYSVVEGKMMGIRFGLVIGIHLTAGILMRVPKVAFSYINKSVIMLAVLGIAMFFPPASLFYYVIALFDIWGLFFDCPCMMVYERKGIFFR